MSKPSTSPTKTRKKKTASEGTSTGKKTKAKPKAGHKSEKSLCGRHNCTRCRRLHPQCKKSAHRQICKKHTSEFKQRNRKEPTPARQRLQVLHKEDQAHETNNNNKSASKGKGKLAKQRKPTSKGSKETKKVRSIKAVAEDDIRRGRAGESSVPKTKTGRVTRVKKVPKRLRDKWHLPVQEICGEEFVINDNEDLVSDEEIIHFITITGDSGLPWPHTPPVVSTEKFAAFNSKQVTDRLRQSNLKRVLNVMSSQQHENPRKCLFPQKYFTI